LVVSLFQSLKLWKSCIKLVFAQKGIRQSSIARFEINTHNPDRKFQATGSKIILDFFSRKGTKELRN